MLWPCRELGNVMVHVILRTGGVQGPPQARARVGGTQRKGETGEEEEIAT